MKKAIFLISLVLCVAILSADPAEVLLVVGDDVELIRDGESEILEMGAELEASDIVKTGDDGMVEIQLPDGTTFTVNANQEIKMEKFLADGGSANTDTMLFLSALKTKVSKVLTTEEDVTPSAVCGVRGNEVGENRFKVFWETGEIDPAQKYQEIFNLYRNGCFKEAIDNMSKFSETFPEDKEKAYYVMGKSYFELMDYDKSVQYLEMSGDYDARSTFLIGVSSLYNMDFNRAIESFEKSIDFEEDASKVYYFLAITYKAKGDMSRAKKYQKKINKKSDDFKMKI